MINQQEPSEAIRDVIIAAAGALDDDDLLTVFSNVYEDRTGTSLEPNDELPIPLESPYQVSLGDKLLWNDRKKAATVEKITQDKVVVRGPQGGEGAESKYWFTFDEDDGIPRYHYGTSALENHTPTSGRANNLRIVGRENTGESQ